MANAHRGTFRYATLTGDRFFSPIRHSTPLMTTLYSARGAARRFFFSFLFSVLSFSFETVTQQSSILRPWCAAELELLYSEEVFLPSRVSFVSHERVYSCLLRRMILSVFHSSQGQVSLGFPVFPTLLYIFCFLSQDFEIIAAVEISTFKIFITNMNHYKNINIYLSR